MTARIEWRSKGAGHGVLLFVSEFGEDSNTVLKKWDANTDNLGDFLNDMTGFDLTITTGPEVDVDLRAPEDWGKLVMARAKEGDILGINPELYWDGIYESFRKHGLDPHPWARTHG